MESRTTHILLVALLIGVVFAPTIGQAAPSIHPGGIVDASGNQRSTTNGGEIVYICGDDFSTQDTVRFGGEPAKIVDVTSVVPGTPVADSNCNFGGGVDVITAIVPSHGAGFVTVVVEGPSGASSSVTSGYEYTQAPAPTITAVSPAATTTNGGGTVTLTGTGFHTGANPVEVTIGTARVVIRTISSTSITADMPAHFVGSLGARVENPDGQVATLASAVTVSTAAVATISSVTPSATPITSNNHHAPFAGFPSPLPSTGPINVTIAGSGFDAFDPHNATAPDSSGSVVHIGGVAATIVPPSNSTSITAIVPALPAGTHDLTVYSPDGQETISVGAVAVTADTAPTLSALAPRRGPSIGGTPFTLTGTGFALGAGVTPPTILFDGAPALDVTWDSTTEVSGIVPPGTVGAVDVTYIGPDGQSITFLGAYTYTETFRPITTESTPAITPLGGNENGGTIVKIHGEGFSAGDKVFFDIVGDTDFGGGSIPEWEQGSVTLNADGDLLTFRTVAYPFSAAGGSMSFPQFVDVLIRKDDGRVLTLHDGFAFINAAAPTFSSITPDEGTELGGTTVTIRGSGFATGAKAIIGGFEALSTTVVSSTRIDAVTAGAISDDGAVQILNPAGDRVTAAGEWTYESADDPVISSRSPSRGDQNGGTEITLIGSGFGTTREVQVVFEKGGVTVPATSVTPLGSTAMRVVAPPSPDGTDGTATLRLTNPDGEDDTVSFRYDEVDAPTVTSKTRSSGPDHGGTTFRVRGTNFVPGAQAIFVFNWDTSRAAHNEFPAAMTTYVSPTALDVTTPAVNATGTVLIMIRNPGGDISLTEDSGDGYEPHAPSAFAFNAGLSPVVSSVDPPATAAEGGAMVRIIGSNFGLHAKDSAGDPHPALNRTTQVPRVEFGLGVFSPSVTVVNAGELLVEVPTGLVPGSKPALRVSNPAGTAGTLGSGILVQFDEPRFTSMSLSEAGSNGGDIVSVTASDLTCAGTCSALGLGSAAVEEPEPVGGSVPFSGLTPITISDSSMTAVLPVHEPGRAGYVIARADGQSAALLGAMDIDRDLPSIFASSAAAATCDAFPTDTASGPAAGGSVFTVFVACDAPGFFVGGTEATQTVIEVGGRPAKVSPSYEADPNGANLTLEMPRLSAGRHDIVAISPDGSRSTYPGGWLALGAAGAVGPAITSVSPTTGSSLGGTLVSISGFNLGAVTEVKFGANPATDVNVVSPTLVTAVTPAGTPGAVGVTVTAGTTSDTLPSGFTYLNAPSPVFANLLPNSGSSLGGTTVVITGQHFSDGVTVTFGGKPAISVTRDSSSQLTVVTPGNPPGPVDVVITNSDNKAVTAQNAFSMVQALGPNLLSIEPASGGIAGGTAVVLTGTRFASVPGVKVLFDGIEATSVTVVDATTINAVTPGHVSGKVDVEVVHPDNQNSTLVEGFEYKVSSTPTTATAFDLQRANVALRFTTKAGDFGDGRHLLVFKAKEINPPLDGVLISAAVGEGRYQVIADLPRDSEDFQNGTYIVDPAQDGARYIVTGYYGELGHFAIGADPSTTPGFEAIEEGVEASGGGGRGGRGGGSGISTTALVLLILAIVSVLAMLIAVILSARRGDAAEVEEANDDYGWDQGQASGGAGVGAGAAAGAAVGGGEAWQEVAAGDEHAMTCPSCAETFTAVGSLPLVTHCPNCGKKGVLR